MFYVFILILLLFLLGLAFLAFPLLLPFTQFLHWIFTFFNRSGIHTYSHYTISNNKSRINNIQKGILLSFVLIIFIDCIANTQAGLLHINMKYYYGSSFSIIPEDTSLVAANTLINQLKLDSITSPLETGWIANPLLEHSGSLPYIQTVGRAHSHSVRM